ncbi:MAG: hypothetical protein LUG18_16110 [Candidatus Azobacteroides sp.]|nr:hypothetical protein [Candidatus Azobacteroides sp.]
MQTGLRFFLLIAAILLTILCANNIFRTVNFDKQRADRERIVSQRLECLRQAQVLFFEKNGYYTNELDTLIDIINNNIRLCEDDSVKYIPFTNGKTFELETGIKMGNTGDEEMACEIKALFIDYLSGTNKDELRKMQLNALQTGQYPGIKVTSDNR